jgi:hypothetical protein
MKVVEISAVLKNITGFASDKTGDIEKRHNEVWHWFKHCFGFLGDVPHVVTVEDYLKIGREVGRKAAQNERGTYTKVRDTDDAILVYWEPQAGQRGLFMAVRPTGLRSGEIMTLFSPDERKRYFDWQLPVAPTFH